MTRVKKLSEDLENPLEHVGIVVTRVGRPSYFKDQTAQALQASFPALMLTSQIKERSAVAESAAKNTSIFGLSDWAAIAEFEALGDELLDKLGLDG